MGDELNFTKSCFSPVGLLQRLSHFMVKKKKNSPANAGDIRDEGLILGQEDPLEEGNLLQYSCLDNPMDREAWQATVHRVAKSQT